jgi:hypothetical protein
LTHLAVFGKIAVMFLRRLLLVALVLASLAQVGCAAYEIRRPMASEGTVLVTWRVDPSRVPDGHCGWAQEIARGHYLLTFKRAFDVNEECTIHELWHALGGKHQ